MAESILMKYILSIESNWSSPSWNLLSLSWSQGFLLSSPACPPMELFSLLLSSLTKQRSCPRVLLLVFLPLQLYCVYERRGSRSTWGEPSTGPVNADRTPVEGERKEEGGTERAPGC
jgi:hypothetical protein